MAFMLFAASCSTKQTSGIDLTNLDTTATAGNDFYQYACGGWMVNNPLTGEYSRFGSFDKLGENNRTQLNTLIEEIAAKNYAQGSIEQKIGDLYNLSLDSVKRNANGLEPLKPVLAQIAAIADKSEFSAILPQFQLAGVASGLFLPYVEADIMNSDINLLQFYQGGYALGEREYYLENDEKTTEIRQKYLAHIERMFTLVGVSAAEAKANAATVLRIETALATAAYDNVKLRNPAANYNKMPFDSLSALVPQINWNVYFENLNVKKQDVSVCQKEFFVETGKLLQNETLADLKTLFSWQAIDGAANSLNDEIYDLNFDFFGKTLSGKEETQPRWKRAVGVVNGVLGEAVGQMYVKKYFPETSKQRMLALVKNLQTALGERIDNLDWMGDSTKVRAHEKLNTFHVKIGYPDKWRDYSALNIDKNLSYYENIRSANRFAADYQLSKAGKPVDKDEWLMTPQTVNAYYNPTTNEICFPAGILQYPFFDMQADDAFNYGAIGVVIGHEMTHGFDDQGSQFDKDGNLNNWWTAADKENFNARTATLADYYDAIEVASGVHANGKFTLGENIADYGGLQVAFQAFKNAVKNAPLPVKDGFTPEQRFFLAYANVWAANIRPEEILVRTKGDPHSLGRWRVNGQMPHNDHWYAAFGITENDALYLAPEKRVSIW
ncbi:MAG: M13 family metallopeptidase [Paludibacter sp.]|nr:M13 family metallopeptidase [Paludibacter sp.]